MIPLARWGEPGRGVKPSQVTAGAPFGAAMEAAKRAAQHKRTDSIFFLIFHSIRGQDIALYMQLLLVGIELLCC